MEDIEKYVNAIFALSLNCETSQTRNVELNKYLTLKEFVNDSFIIHKLDYNLNNLLHRLKNYIIGYFMQTNNIEKYKNDLESYLKYNGITIHHLTTVDTIFNYQLYIYDDDLKQELIATLIIIINLINTDLEVLADTLI